MKVKFNVCLLNYHLSWKFMLLGNREFNYLIIIITPPSLIKKKKKNTAHTCGPKFSLMTGLDLVQFD